MPTPVSTARQCLAGDAAAALDAAVAAARRRFHSQTTSLHVVFALLSCSSSSPSILRDAVARARSSGFSPRLQMKALELCFGVALDRLPSSSSSAIAASENDEPMVSNSLMAAIKRSQASQRRHPDTFHLYQQQQQSALGASSSASSSAFTGVKVEMQQLVLAVLDDPIVSRVFGEAGFRSCEIKLAIVRQPPPPPILRSPHAARCPPLFLSNFSSSSEGFSFPFPSTVSAAAQHYADGGEQNCQRISEVLVRKPGCSRNPMLLGIGAAEAAADFIAAIERQNSAGLLQEIQSMRVLSIEDERDPAAIGGRMEEISRETESGVVVSIGDLKGLMEGGDAADYLVSELTKVLELRPRKVWVMGWSGNYETYLKFLSRYPSLDKDWDLQLLPITSHRGEMGGSLQKSPRFMESFVPFSGLFPQVSESMGALHNPYFSTPLCRVCNEKYEQELAAILMGSPLSSEDLKQLTLPSWLQRTNTIGMRKRSDVAKVEDDEYVLNTKIMELKRKWNEYCKQLHSSPEMENDSQIVLNRDGVPLESDDKTISLPLSSQSVNMDLISKLQDNRSWSQPRDIKSELTAPSNLSIYDCHVSSSSFTSVKTDLVLSTVQKPSNFELKSAQLTLDNRSKCSSQCLSAYVEFPENSKKVPADFLSGTKSVCDDSQKFDARDYKALYMSLLEKVGRQEEALKAISEAVICRKSKIEKSSRSSLRGDIWLNFLGPDRVGKRKAAMALAETIFGSREHLICINLAYSDNTFCQNIICSKQELENSYDGLRGKTIGDQIALEIRRNPLSVFFLENVDKADFLVQNSLLNAIRSGKFSDSHGREFNINSSIFITSVTKGLPCKVFSLRKENVGFSEESILSVRKTKMMILLEPPSKQESPCPVFISKRKSDSPDEKKEPHGLISPSKRPRRTSSTALDLNLPVEEPNYVSEYIEGWLKEFFALMDENLIFEPFDFDALANDILNEISMGFCSRIRSNWKLEIDLNVMEQILAATWLLKNRNDLNQWIEDVLLKGIKELRNIYDVSDSIVLRLISSHDLSIGECFPGLYLPSRIILEQ